MSPSKSDVTFEKQARYYLYLSHISAIVTHYDFGEIEHHRNGLNGSK